MNNNIDFIKTLKQHLDETLSKTVSDNWMKYLQFAPMLRNATSWMIFSDYCIGDKKKHNDSISFVICPTTNIELLSSEINKFIPNDIKNTRDIKNQALNYLKFPYYFSINFAIDDIKSYSNLYVPNNDKKALYRDVEFMYNNLNSVVEKTDFQKSFSKKIKMLREKIKSNNFKTYNYCKILIVAFLASYVALFVTTHTKVKELLWLSDRGMIFDFLDGLCFDMYNQIYHNLLLETSILIPKPNPFGIANKAKDEKSLWYNSLIKLPDYYAGTIASWDLNTNNADDDKHVKVIENVFVDNPNFNLIKINLKDMLLQSGRVDIKRK